MDYAQLTENEQEVEGEQGSLSRAEESLTMLVMHEDANTSIWSYAVEHKGAGEDWLIGQLLEDLETVGLKNEKVVAKADQEPSMTDVVREIVKQRESDFGTAVEQSAVGESDTNATIEKAIQDVEGQIRTMRAALELKVKENDYTGAI